MEKPESEELTGYKRWLVDQFHDVIKKIELAHSVEKTTKDFIYVSDLLNILNGNDFDSYEPPLREYDVLSKYFDSIQVDFVKKSNYTLIKCWNVLGHKTTVAHNFYEVIVSLSDKKVLILGNIDGQPYEYKYYYRSLYHLERIIKETFIQNCLFAKHEKQTGFQFKGEKKK